MRLGWLLLFLPAAVHGARVILAAGDDGIGTRRNAFTVAATAPAVPLGEDPPELPPVWRKKLQVSEPLAAGGFGTVYKAKVTCDGSSRADLAMKVVRPSYSSEKEAAALKAMHGVSDYCSSSVGNPGLVDYKGCHYILLPFMNHGDLFDLLTRCLQTPSCRCRRAKMPRQTGLREHPLCWEALGPPFSEAMVLALMLQVMRGVRALHRHHLIHMDLKPENVMLHCKGSHCYAQVVDLGLVCKENHDCVLSGTVGYIAPEVWQRTHVGIPANDVFSLGVMLYTIEFASLPPFSKDEDGSLTARYDPKTDPKLLHRPPAQRAMANLIGRMLEPRPYRRITLKDAENKLREITLSRNSSQAILDMIEKTPEKAGAKSHLPDCIEEGAAMPAKGTWLLSGFVMLNLVYSI